MTEHKDPAHKNHGDDSQNAPSQQRMMELRMLEEKIQALAKHKEMVNSRISEIDGTKNGLEEVSKAKEDVIFHVGGEAFVKAKPIKDSKVVVMLGADVAVEKSIEEAKSILDSRRKEATDALAEVDKEIQTLTKQAEKAALGIQM